MVMKNKENIKVYFKIENLRKIKNGRPHNNNMFRNNRWKENIQIKLNSIRTKLGLSFFALVVVLSTALVLVLSFVLGRILETQMKSALQIQASQVSQLVDIFESSLYYTKNKSYENYDEKLKEEVILVINTIEQFTREGNSKNIAQNEIKNRAKEYIRNLRLEDGRFFWVFDSNYNVIVYPPDTSMEGQNKQNMTDVYGKKMIKEMVDKTVENQEGFTDYVTNKIGSSEYLPRRAYSKYLKDWDWIVSSTNYMDKIDTEIRLLADKIQQDFQAKLTDMGKLYTIFVLNGEKIDYASDEKLVREKLHIIDENTRKSILELLPKDKDDFLSFSVRNTNDVVEKMVGYVGSGNNNRKILIFKKESDIFRPVYEVYKYMIIIVCLALIVAIVGSLILGGRFVKPINLIKSKLEYIANGEGDLTETINFVSKDELGILSQCFNKFINSIRFMIQKIATSGSDVNKLSIGISNMMQELVKSTGAIMESLMQISDNIVEQNEEVNKTVKITEQLCERIDEASENSKKVKVSSEKAQYYNQEGMNMAEMLVKKQEETTASFNEVMVVLKNLLNRLNDISTFIKISKRISSQTKMLSLNASIEAAKAGEYGKGFAVVADEINNLAKAAEEATKNIEMITQNVNLEISNTRQWLEKNIIVLKEQENIITNTESLYKDIYTSVKEIIDSVEEVIRNIYTMDIYKNEIIVSMNSLSKASKDTQNNVQNITAVTEEQFAVTQEVSSIANNLMQTSEQLKDLIGNFKY